MIIHIAWGAATPRRNAAEGRSQARENAECGSKKENRHYRRKNNMEDYYEDNESYEISETAKENIQSLIDNILEAGINDL